MLRYLKVALRASRGQKKESLNAKSGLTRQALRDFFAPALRAPADACPHAIGPRSSRAGDGLVALREDSARRAAEACRSAPRGAAIPPPTCYAPLEPAEPDLFGRA